MTMPVSSVGTRDESSLPPPITDALTLTEGHFLPAHWRRASLGDIAREFVSGGTPSTKDPEQWDGTVAWTTSAPISEDDVLLDRSQRYITDKGLLESATHLVPAGNLLVGTRVGVGKAVVTSLDIAISQDLTGAVLDQGRADPEFIAYQFKTEGVQAYFDGRKRGTTIKGISRYDLEELPISLPPLAEQRAIARVLRAVREAIAARRHELALERERKAALMAHLFSHGTRGEPTQQTAIGEMPRSWRVVEFGSLIGSGPKNGLYKPQSEYGHGTLIVRINDFDNAGEVVDGAANRVELTPSEIAEYRLHEDDLLINRVNSLSHLGKTALVGPLVEQLVFESNMMRVSMEGTAILPQFAFRFLNLPPTRERICAIAKRAVAQSSINQGDVRALQIPLPSRDEQQWIVDTVDACDTLIAALEREIALHEELFRALLEELMSGRLSALPLAEAEDTDAADVVAMVKGEAAG